MIYPYIVRTPTNIAPDPIYPDTQLALTIGYYLGDTFWPIGYNMSN